MLVDECRPARHAEAFGDTVGQTHAAPWGAAAMWVPWHPVQGVFQDVRPSIALVVNELALIRELHDEGLRRAHGSGKRYGDPRFVEVFRRTSVVRSLDELERLAYELNRYLRRIRYAGEQRHVVDVVHVVGHHATPPNISHLEHWRETEANRVEWLVGLYQERGARPGVTIPLECDIDVGPKHAGPPSPGFAIWCQWPR